MRRINAEKLMELIYAHSTDRQNRGELGACEVLINQDGRRVADMHLNAAKGTMWRLASMTKPVTAAAVMKQVEAGKIDLYKPVSDYLPQFSEMTVNDRGVLRPAYGKVLVYQLLSHTSGIGSCDYAAIYPEEQAAIGTLEAAAAFSAKLPLAFDPGLGCAYSPLLALDVAARIVEITSGMNYAQFLNENIFDPVGMDDATFEPSEEQRARFIPVFARDEKGSPTVDTNPDFDSMVFGGCRMSRCAAGAGLACTAEDYSRFAEMLLWGGKNVLTEQSVKTMSTPHIAENIMPGTERWGLGVRVITSPGYKHGLPVGSYGWSGAYGTHFWVDPVNRITAVYMKNGSYDGGAGNMSACELERDVMAALI